MNKKRYFIHKNSQLLYANHFFTVPLLFHQKIDYSANFQDDMRCLRCQTRRWRMMNWLKKELAIWIIIITMWLLWMWCDRVNLIFFTKSPSVTGIWLTDEPTGTCALIQKRQPQTDRDPRRRFFFKQCNESKCIPIYLGSYRHHHTTQLFLRYHKKL